ncbi:methionine ABC transporter permease [Kurthia sibirica]|uniref:Metal ABC transporter permease n=1 Tax=Kurthia sibirica TaxID=202750 RepID=A0A2U3APS4_9BACL|nr:methionine ABC transporter permease [Kurthia sibirica]PWI26524.1 metal ABC transporter permease [Kurthia sibirica]GEK32768.1 ABC transporter permease [Kurthia sibirica]
MSTFIDDWGELLWKGIIETFQMTSISLIIAILIGVPLGIAVVLTRPGQLLANRVVYQILNIMINIVRSIPFIILLFFIIPFTKYIVGTTIGVQGIIVPLVLYTAPYIARLMESAFLEVDQGVIEAYKAMGMKKRQIIWHVLLREARPSMILGLTLAVISLIGATAMAGLVGGGGLGDIAYRYGFQQYKTELMYVVVAMLIILVQIIQTIGNRWAARLKRN